MMFFFFMSAFSLDASKKNKKNYAAAIRRILLIWYRGIQLRSEGTLRPEA